MVRKYAYLYPNFKVEGEAAGLFLLPVAFSNVFDGLLEIIFPKEMSKCSFVEGSAKVLPKIQEPPKMLMPDESIQL